MHPRSFGQNNRGPTKSVVGQRSVRGKQALWEKLPTKESADSPRARAARKNLDYTHHTESRNFGTVSHASSRNVPRYYIVNGVLRVFGEDERTASDPPPKLAQERRPETEPTHDLADDSIDDELATVFGKLDLGANHLLAYHRVPFLRRNLRQSFSALCALNKVPTGSKGKAPADTSVQVIYQLQGRSTKVKGMMDSWSCPICNFYGRFNTREMLTYHLKYHHVEVEASWEAGGLRKVKWKLLLVLPTITDSDSSDSSVRGDDSESSPEPAAEQALEQLPAVIHELEPTPEPSAGDIKSEVDQPLSLQDHAEVLDRLRAMNAGPPPAPSSTHQAILLPPPSDLLGPAAQYPYIPDDQYSYRPGGPFLMDLLNHGDTLSLEPYGVLSWMIVDREEEIYELDEIKDEVKVMLALWNRWIFLNRNTFVFDGYARGVHEFIDEYWEMIHLAAGWDALRTFLLVLLTKRFLNMADVAKLLKHYESKTGMAEWYK